MRNLKWKVMLPFLVMAVIGVSLGGCGEKEDKENSDDAMHFRAVYLKNDQGDLFVDLDAESPFVGTIPEEIVDEDEQPLTADSMENGDVFLVYGDGIMLESYPGQYPGITKLERQESGNREYAEKYQKLMDQIYPEPDVSEPPQLSVEYRQPEAVVIVNITRGSYNWNVEMENGETETTTADSAHVLEWKDERIDLVLKEDTELTLQFGREPESVEAVCWPVGERREAGTSEVYPVGEAVEISETEDGFTFVGRPGQVYRVKAYWEQGEAEYGFYTVKK